MDKKYAHIKGWGIDQDPKNNPNYPMRSDRAGDIAAQRPVQQIEHVEILQSIERSHPSAVIGTTLPPAGCSGVLRRIAFKYSENQYRHWLTLLLADRVQLVEGWVEDVQEGKYPKLFIIKNKKIHWEHHQIRRVKKLAVTGLLIWGICKILKSK